MSDYEYVIEVLKQRAERIKVTEAVIPEIRDDVSDSAMKFLIKAREQYADFYFNRGQAGIAESVLAGECDKELGLDQPKVEHITLTYVTQPLELKELNQYISEKHAEECSRIMQEEIDKEVIEAITNVAKQK